MDIQQLSYFLAIAKHKSLLQAAQKLHVTQSALSQYVQRLEAEIGCPLFTKSGRHMLLNSRGILVLEWAQKALYDYRAVVDEISRLYTSDAQTAMQKTVSLNIASSGYVYSLPILVGFQNAHPEIIVNNILFEKDDFPEIIFNPSIQCVLSIRNYTSAHVCSTFLYSSPLYFIVPKGHPLAERNGVYFYDFRNERLTITNDNNLFELLLSNCFDHAGSYMNVAHKMQVPHLIQAAGQGAAVTIFAAETVAQYRRQLNNCSIIPILDDFAKMDLYLLWKKASSDICPKELTMFLDYCRKGDYRSF